MNTFKTLIVASTAFAAFAAAPYVNADDQPLPNDEHAAMAQEFQARAAAANEKAAAHQVMARAGGSPKANRHAMASHCERLIAQYEAEAAEYAAKAAEHERLATAQ